VLFCEPVIDRPNSSALATTGLRVAQFADPAPALDERAACRIFDQEPLQVGVLVVAQQVSEQACEGRGLDEFHFANLYAIGVSCKLPRNVQGLAAEWDALEECVEAASRAIRDRGGGILGGDLSPPPAVALGAETAASSKFGISAARYKFATQGRGALAVVPLNYGEAAWRRPLR
jgi:hypothetical protein